MAKPPYPNVPKGARQNWGTVRQFARELLRALKTQLVSPTQTRPVANIIEAYSFKSVSYTHLRAHETEADL
eukprot:1456710-Amphidinium_carterae.1